ncbi:succinate-semialdehyde dehydrogenase [Babesia caballi]|uniref:Succinate-semialdehyde dehydrogenase n=1 Tax=Babesia caballi TaxID=5871 RepID=A0AAV4M0N0_BABCB|nr:succinate-semialdehyde dehydrogenase [Babesia caballi]
MSRQEGANKSAKAAEVEAVAATGQCGEPRVAKEGRGGRDGGIYSVEEISDEVVANEVERGRLELTGKCRLQLTSNLLTANRFVELNTVEAHLGQELLKGAIIFKFRILPTILL